VRGAASRIEPIGGVLLENAGRIKSQAVVKNCDPATIQRRGLEVLRGVFFSVLGGF
jgi:hypothetical protein